MYVRFAVAEIDEDSQRGLGVFQAAYRLRDQGKLDPYEEAHLKTVLEWFKVHLERPTRFTSAKTPHYRKQAKAISWFKDTAHEHIRYIRDIVSTLENHGILVRMLKADRVGYVVYEDDFQIIAEAFADLQC